MSVKEFFIKEGRLRPTWRVVSYLLALILGQIAITVPIVLLLLVLSFVGAVDETVLTKMQSPFALMVINMLASLLVILPLTYLFRRFLDRDTLVSLGFRRRVGWVKQMVGGLLLGALLIGLIFITEWGAGWIQVQGFAWQIRSPFSVVMSMVGLLIVLIASAFYEELSFRGYILQNVSAEWGPVVALLASSVLFGLFHGLNPNFSWVALLNIFLAGVLLAVCYLVTKDLWLPMAFHFSWNFVQGPVLSFPVSGLGFGGLLLTEGGGNPLVTGGAFGPEGGLISTAAMCLGLVILLLLRRR